MRTVNESILKNSPTKSSSDKPHGILSDEKMKRVRECLKEISNHRHDILVIHNDDERGRLRDYAGYARNLTVHEGNEIIDIHGRIRYEKKT